MSVINNVLRNLESRESGFTPVEINPIASRPVPTRHLTLLLPLAALLLVIAGVAWYFLQDQTPKTASTPIAAVSGIAPVMPLPAAKTDIEPGIETGAVTEQVTDNQIVGLQIRESEDDMRLEFVLEDKVIAYLKKRGKNSFSYHLHDIESRIVAPLISDNRWIRELSIDASETGVDIKLQTAADILVETRQDMRAGEPIWSINLHKSDNVATGGPGAEVANGNGPDVTVSRPAPAPAEEAKAPAVSPQMQNAEVPASPVKIDIKSTNPNNASVNQLEYAAQLINSGRTTKAEALLRELLGGVEDYNARELLLALYGRQKRLDHQRRLLQRSMARYPDAALFRTGYARSLFQGAAYRAVIELFVNENPIDATQQALVAASYQRLEEHENAIRHYRLALVRDANNARNWIGLGISQENTAALAQALGSYRRAIKLGGLNSRLRAFVATRSSALEQVLN